MTQGAVSDGEEGRLKIPLAESGIEIRKTICSICNPVSHCGIDAYVKDGVIIKVEGTKENHHSQGTLCSKGAATRQYVYHKDRIRTPLLKKGKGKSAQFEPISWGQALDIIADRVLEIKAESGPEADVNLLIDPDYLDPISCYPGFKSLLCEIRKA
ncbi:MAG: molybdopterin-dependent oxidoreductase [Deltaproteobacteria bacterium]|nr:molybdopterin-dependent oxidoreductase [Deltaproteobacteria bacterium]